MSIYDIRIKLYRPYTLLFRQSPNGPEESLTLAARSPAEAELILLRDHGVRRAFNLRRMESGARKGGR